MYMATYLTVMHGEQVIVPLNLVQSFGSIYADNRCRVFTVQNLNACVILTDSSPREKVGTRRTKFAWRA